MSSEKPNHLGEEPDLRRYLLGMVGSEDQREAIEERLIVDDDYLEELTFQEDELIEDYLHGQLSLDEKHRFETHFLTSKERREKLEFAKAFIARVRNSDNFEISQPRKASFWTILAPYFSPIPVAAALLVGISAGFALWVYFSNRQGESEGLLALNRAYKTERPVESRIAEFDYAPYYRVRGDNTPKPDSNEQERAELILRKAATEHPTPNSLDALGRLYIAKLQFDEAISELEKARESGPPTSKLLNDLGVAYLEKFNASPNKFEEKTAALPRKALESFDAAIKLDPKNLEALYNLGLCLEALNLPDQAREAWQKYLELDGTSGWAGEAREHLQRLQSNRLRETSADQREAAFLEAFRENNPEKAFELASENRELIRQQYLPQRLVFSLVDGNRQERSERLAALGFLASVERDRIGDMFASDLLSVYKEATEPQLDILRQAQNSIKHGYDLCLRNNFNDAKEAFQTARSLFLRAADKTEAETVSKYFIAYCLYNLDDRTTSAQLLTEINEFTKQKKYKWFSLMNYYWWLGAQESLGFRSITDTRLDYENALNEAESLQDAYMIQKFLLSLLLKSNFLKQWGSATAYSQRLLAFTNRSGLSSRQRVRNVDKIISLGVDTASPAFSTALALENVTAAEYIGDPGITVVSELKAGIVYTQIGDYENAERWLDQARNDAERLADEPARKDNLSRILLNLGHLERKRLDFHKAADYYTQALDLSGDLRTPLLLYEIRKSRAFAFQAIGDDTALEAEISAAVHLAEDYRRKILDEQERNTFFANEQELYDIAIDHELRQDRLDAAFDLAEQSQARSLLDWLIQGANVRENRSSGSIRFQESSTPLDLQTIQSVMPDSAQILEYRVLNDRLVIWLISKNAFLTFSSPVGGEQLEALIRDFVSNIQDKDPAHQERAARFSRSLYGLLIQPAVAHIDRSKQLCIVADRMLFYLPFAALISGDDRYLIEDFTVMYSPSANIFVRCSKTAEDKRRLNPEKILAIANPSFDRTKFPGLNDLPEAIDEALKISTGYPEAKLLKEHAATPSAFKNVFRDFEVIHFAGHYIAEPASPLASKMVLANGSGQEGFLTNGELIRYKLPRAKLVVLSACRSAIENYYDGEGPVGLARTFLASGAPLVVASSWPVDSHATAELMKSFHLLRTHDRLSTAEAVRRAQLHAIHASPSTYSQPYYWSAFAVFGGYASF